MPARRSCLPARPGRGSPTPPRPPRRRPRPTSRARHRRRPAPSPEPELLAEPARGGDFLAGLVGELGKELALALRELGRHDDVDEDVEIATGTRPPEVRNA